MLVLATAACSQAPEGDRAVEKPAVRVAEKNGLRLELTVDRPKTPGGETVALRLEVANVSGAKKKLTFSSAKTHDFLVLRGSRVIWRWSDDKAFAQAFMSRSLVPGGKLTWRADWDQKSSGGRPAPPGRYRVKAEFLPVGQRLEVGPVEVKIE